MKGVCYLAPLIPVMIMLGCSPSKVTTEWRSEQAGPNQFSKIMVVSIPVREDDSSRNAMEKLAVDKISLLGYDAVGSMETFGSGGLAALGAEATYIRLCENGIDAVLVFARIDRSLPVYHGLAEDRKYTSRFFYDRIWDYRKYSGPGAHPTTAVESNWAWEAIFFDLNLLQPAIVIQASIDDGEDRGEWMTSANRILDQMKRQKVLAKQAMSKRAF